MVKPFRTKAFDLEERQPAFTRKAPSYGAIAAPDWKFWFYSLFKAEASRRHKQLKGLEKEERHQSFGNGLNYLHKSVVYFDRSVTNADEILQLKDRRLKKSKGQTETNMSW